MFIVSTNIFFINNSLRPNESTRPDHANLHFWKSRFATMRARSDQQVDRGGLFDIARHAFRRPLRTDGGCTTSKKGITMPTLERMKDKHNDQVKQLAKVSAKRDKLITSLVRVEFQRVALIRAVARSSKRLDKARSVASLNAPLPSTESLDLGSLTPQQADKVIASAPLPTYDFDKAVTLAELSATDAGKANAKSWDAIPAVRKAKAKAKPTPHPLDIPADLRRKQPAPKPIPPDQAREVSALNRQLNDTFFGKPVRAIPHSEAHPHSKKGPIRKRRTPDDFKADMDSRK
jgi:hypothetical protein